MLSPVTMAVVGANEQSGMSNNAVVPMLATGRPIALVNPRRDAVYGQQAYPDLAAIGEPVDAVLSLVNAERSVGVVEEAAALGCGGVVVAAAGFAEAGDAGVELQRRLRDVAERTGIAVVGPNCAGFRNVPLGVSLFTGGRLDLPVSGQGDRSAGSASCRRAGSSSAPRWRRRRSGLSASRSPSRRATKRCATSPTTCRCSPRTR